MMRNLLSGLLIFCTIPLVLIMVSCEKEEEGIISVSEVDADFSAGATDVSVNTTVTFMNQSSGDVTHWSWSFEGGTPAISHEKNPTVTYKAAGNFDVKLVVSNSKYTDMQIKSEYISVKP